MSQSFPSTVQSSQLCYHGDISSRQHPQARLIKWSMWPGGGTKDGTVIVSTFFILGIQMTYVARASLGERAVMMLVDNYQLVAVSSIEDGTFWPTGLPVSLCCRLAHSGRQLFSHLALFWSLQRSSKLKTGANTESWMIVPWIYIFYLNWIQKHFRPTVLLSVHSVWSLFLSPFIVSFYTITNIFSCYTQMDLRQELFFFVFFCHLHSTQPLNHFHGIQTINPLSVCDGAKPWLSRGCTSCNAGVQSSLTMLRQ